MLARKYHLRNKSDFDALKASGKKLSSESFTVIYKDNPKSEVPRFGFIISKKISNHASVRNKSKRALSEGARRSTSVLNRNIDCLFLAKPIIVKKYTNELMKEVEQALIKLSKE